MRVDDELLDTWDRLRQAVNRILTTQPDGMTERASILRTASDRFSTAFSNAMVKAARPVEDLGDGHWSDVEPATTGDHIGDANEMIQAYSPNPNPKREAMEDLFKAALDVYSEGAMVGPKWLRLGSAIDIARKALGGEA